MSATATKMWSKTGGSLSSALLSQLTQVWSLTEGYQVTCDPTETIVDVVSAIDLPVIGQVHPDISTSFVRAITPERVSPILWIVTVAYDGITSDDGIDVEWSDSTSTEPIDRDWNGRAITTVNREPVDGLTVEIADQICTVRRKFLTIDTAGIAAYRRSTNSDTFLGWPPGTARLIGFSAKNRFQFSGIQEQWDVTAQFQFREPYANTTPEEAWYNRWRHEGYYVRVYEDSEDPESTFVIRRAIDEFGQETNRPVLLKENGEQEFDPDAAYFFHTQVYDSLPYAALGLF